MLVTLPSGAIAPLEAPSLPSLLAAGGDLERIAAAAFAHDELDASELSEGDGVAVCMWALDRLAESADGLELAIIAESWGRPPSEFIGLSDLPLAWQLDRALHLRLAAERRDGPPPDEDGDTSGHVRFTSGGPEE
jgi:hypothetical protein